MKKFVAMLLAVMMILSCAALAADKNMTNVHTGNATPFKKSEDKKSAEQKTDVWLQVEAAGTIDVTVPLVLVFKTNIDGGNCDSPEGYKITNNSTAALKVTKVEITDDYADVSANGNTSKMKMVNALTGAYDEYTLMMNVDDQYEIKNWTVAKNVHFNNDTSNGDGIANFEESASGKTFTIAKGSGAEEAGLWLIEKGTAPSTVGGTVTGKDSRVTFTLATSKLSYVTHQAKNEASGDDENTENGVKLFHVNYTVMIDDSNAVGADIKGVGLDTDQNYSYAVSDT